MKRSREPTGETPQGRRPRLSLEDQARYFWHKMSERSSSSMTEKQYMKLYKNRIAQTLEHILQERGKQSLPPLNQLSEELYKSFVDGLFDLMRQSAIKDFQEFFTKTSSTKDKLKEWQTKTGYLEDGHKSVKAGIHSVLDQMIRTEPMRLDFEEPVFREPMGINKYRKEFGKVKRETYMAKVLPPMSEWYDEIVKKFDRHEFKMPTFKKFTMMKQSMAYFKEYGDTTPDIAPQAYELRNILLPYFEQLGVNQKFIKKLQDDRWAQQYFAPKIFKIAIQNMPASSGNVKKILSTEPEVLIGNYKPELYSVEHFQATAEMFDELKKKYRLTGAPRVERDVIGRGGAGMDDEPFGGDLFEKHNIMVKSSEYKEAIQDLREKYGRKPTGKEKETLDKRAEELRKAISEEIAGGELSEAAMKRRVELLAEILKLGQEVDIDPEKRDGVVETKDHQKANEGMRKSTFTDSTGKERETGVNYPTMFPDRRGHFNTMDERKRLYQIQTRFSGNRSNPEGKLRRYAQPNTQVRSDARLFKNVSAMKRFTT